MRGRAGREPEPERVQGATAPGCDAVETETWLMVAMASYSPTSPVSSL
ncbi:MAG: hypothetical protein AAF653_21165 [Chloroflexota bacterium]